MADELKIDFGDGVSALDRANRAIVLMLDGAIAELIELGYRRDFDHITLTVDPQDPMEGPGVLVRGELVYALSFVNEGGIISIQGHWVKRPARRRWYQRIFARRYRAGAS